jgi:hypothetical protein
VRGRGGGHRGYRTGNALGKYAECLRRYHDALDVPDRAEREALREALVREMEGLWAKMGDRERERTLEYAGELYRQRIGGARDE